MCGIVGIYVARDVESLLAIGDLPPDLLPAFVLIGIVPLVAALLTSLDL